MKPSALLAALLVAVAMPAMAQSPGPLRIEITEGVSEPLPIALPRYAAADARAAALAEEVRAVVKADLQSSGVFRVIDEAAYLSAPAGVDARPAFENWRVINADAVGAGQVAITPDGPSLIEGNVKWDPGTMTNARGEMGPHVQYMAEALREINQLPSRRFD